MSSNTTVAVPGREDPGLSWDTPVWHPLARPGSGHGDLVPVPATIRDPLCLGLCPPAGTPLTLRLWDGDGAKVVLVISRAGDGRTTLLDDINERITACPDARLIQISLARASHADRWAPLAAASALRGSPAQPAQVLTFAAEAIAARSRARPGAAVQVHQPTATEPLYVLEIEDPAVAAGSPAARQLLGWIAARCRAQGWALILATSRATAVAAGGPAVLDAASIAVCSPRARPAGPGSPAAMAPGLDSCAAGTPGVFGICDLPPDGTGQHGRAFCWGDRSTAGAVVASRLAARSPQVLEPALAGLQPVWDQITGG